MAPQSSRKESAVKARYLPLSPSEPCLGSHPGTGAKPGRGIASASARKAAPKRQMNLLRFIQGHIEAKGYAPTMQTMASAMGFRSRSAVAGLLIDLELRGFIRRRRARACSVEVIAPRPIPRAPDGVPLYFIPAGQLPGGAMPHPVHAADDNHEGARNNV